MVSKFILSLVIFLGSLTIRALSEVTPYKLVDEICVTLDNTPILRSEIEKLKKENQVSFSKAREDLMLKEALFIYAENTLKVNLSDIHKSAEKHLQSIMEKNKLSRSQFAQVLKDTYKTNLKAYEKETAYLILKNQVEQTLRQEIQVDENEMKEAKERYLAEARKRFDVVFVTLTPIDGQKNEQKNSSKEFLSPQKIEAKKIKEYIGLSRSLKKIKDKYESVRGVSIVGPIAYEKGVLKDIYEKKLSGMNGMVSEPFVENGSVKIIWKVQKNLKDHEILTPTVLEELQKGRYQEKVQRKLFSILKSTTLENTSTVMNCEK